MCVCVRLNKPAEQNLILAQTTTNILHMDFFKEFICKKKPENRPDKYENENQTKDG